MTDLEAIEYAENELENTSYTLETNNKLRGGLFKILSTKFEFLVTAKSALQEREERSKGCEWCKDLANPQWRGQHLAIIEGDSFCRKCGRPLKGADND